MEDTDQVVKKLPDNSTTIMGVDTNQVITEKVIKAHNCQRTLTEKALLLVDAQSAIANGLW